MNSYRSSKPKSMRRSFVVPAMQIGGWIPMESYFKYLYQNGGSPLLPPLPSSPLPTLPNYAPVPQMLYRPNSMGDMRTNAGLPDPSEIRRQQLLSQVVEAAKVAAAKIEMEKANQKKKLQQQIIPDSRAKGDIVSNYNLPNSDEARRASDQNKIERENLQNRLERLGYKPRVAGMFAEKGRDNLLQSVQKQLDDQDVIDERVRTHPDYDSNQPVEDQQDLGYDNSLRAGLLRQRNRLINTDMPVMNFVTKALTAPAKSFINLTMDADNQYIKPGLVQGSLNLGDDLLTLWPSAPDLAASAIVNRASPHALAYMANPVMQGVDDLGQQYFKNLADSKSLERLAPKHAEFVNSVNEGLNQGVPLKDAIRGSYRPLPGDNMSGLDLYSQNSPRQVYEKMRQAHESLPEGRRFINPSYSLDSYPLALDYITNNLDKGKYNIIPTYKNTDLNAFGFKSPAVINALPENMQDAYTASLKKLEELNREAKIISSNWASTKSPALKLRYDDIKDKADEIQDQLHLSFNDFMNNNEDFRLRYVQGVNDRIKNLNQQHGINMPLAVATDEGIGVPQFFLQKNNPTVLKRFLDFPSRIGLGKSSLMNTASGKVLEKSPGIVDLDALLTPGFLRPGTQIGGNSVVGNLSFLPQQAMGGMWAHF